MTILAAVGEEQVDNPIISVAHELATGLDEDLLVLHVIPEQSAKEHIDAIRALPDMGDYSLTQETDSAARFARQTVTSTLGEFDSDVVSTKGRIGEPASEILAEAEQIDARYIVIGRRKRSPAGKAIFGSTPQAVLLNSDRNVLTVMLS